MSFPRLLIFALLGLILVPAARGQTVHTEPILRIEADQHTAPIRAIDVDAANRLLVTASDDKTARVWDLHSGELRTVLRPPIGPGREGQLFAVAIHPDGSRVAVGGWTQLHGGRTTVSNHGFDVYLFDAATGEMVQRMGGSRHRIQHLAWSPEGDVLAALIGDSNGLRIFKPATGEEVGRDDDYDDQSYGAVFLPDGSLVTTSDDGHLRRYDRSWKRTARTATTGGDRPFQVAVSPDGRRLAVGFDDTTAVEIYDAQSLRRLGAADTTFATQGCLSSVAFTRDGRYLVAAGRFSEQSGGARYHPLLAWSVGTYGLPTRTPRRVNAARNSILDLVPLASGAVAFGAGDPMWGIATFDGRDPFVVDSPTIDLRRSFETLLVSNDGTRVQFANFQTKKSAQLSLADRLLSVGADTSDSLAAPRTTAPGINVTDWQHTREPKLNGNPIALRTHETARSLSISPNGAQFVLGAEWSLRLFARDGTQRWEKPVPGVAWGVNITGDKRMVVASFSDGTIRWFRLHDGEELLAFFPHADGERWILWTPTGYYDASPGGEQLIGWHVNNGLDRAADFFPAGRFRDRFYRPDIIDIVLTELDEGAAIRTANLSANRAAPATSVADALPPVVTITGPRDGDTVASSPVTVTYRVRSAEDAPVTRVWALVDGRPAEGARLVGRPQTEQIGDPTLTVPIPERDAIVSVLAENRHGTSVESTIRVKWDGTTPTPEPDESTLDMRPKVYALLVGVSEYEDETQNLAFAAKDARDFAEVLQAQEGGLYREVEIKVLTDEEATRGAILDGMDWLMRETTQRDVAIFFLAGHGENDTNNVFYFLPHDADLERMRSTCVRMPDIRETLSFIAGKVLFFVDTCHSGSALGPGVRARSTNVNRLINELSSTENGVVVFSASTGRQVSLESDEWGNGAFTKALVEGLRGGAADRGRITIATLEYFISERVKELTDGRQTPVVRKPDVVPDFPIAVLMD
ncbi:MAG: caspase family protein [Candidatus Sumerlaeia bacterium]|nr:caspase family protein [Candidatus Sumerlaeia bacterium]